MTEGGRGPNQDLRLYYRRNDGSGLLIKRSNKNQNFIKRLEGFFSKYPKSETKVKKKSKIIIFGNSFVVCVRYKKRHSCRDRLSLLSLSSNFPRCKLKSITTKSSNFIKRFVLIVQINSVSKDVSK